MYDVMTLECEHYNDGIEQTKERERGEEWEKTCHQKFFGGQIPNSGAGYNACNQWDAQVLQSCENSQMMEKNRKKHTIKTEIATFPYET